MTDHVATSITEREWRDRALPVGNVIDLDQVTIEREQAVSLTLISGDFSKAIGQTNVIGLAEDCGRGAYGIRISHDCVLLVSPKPSQLNHGWHEKGFAVSPADGKYTIFKVSGDGADAIMEQGASAALYAGSPSAITRFAGLDCLVVKEGKSWCIFVETPMATFLTTWLKGAG